MDVKFLFLDEKYADQCAPRAARITSLTGALVPANMHREFRDRYYDLVGKAIGDPDGVISKWPDRQIHASKLLPDSTDDAHFSFLEGLVKLVNEFDFKVYRIGFHTTPQGVAGLQGETGLVEVCFINLLWVLKTSFPDTQVWPVIETDHTARQDQNFAGMMQKSDYIASRWRAKPGELWLRDSNFGEALYMTKRSGYGSLVDCVAYLLHTKWLHSRGHDLKPYKRRLAEIASQLDTVAFDEVGPLNIETVKVS